MEEEELVSEDWAVAVRVAPGTHQEEEQEVGDQKGATMKAVRMEGAVITRQVVESVSSGATDARFRRPIPRMPSYRASRAFL